MKTVTVGSRGSDLARAMGEEVLRKLRASSPKTEFRHRIVTTAGDRDRRTSLSVLGGDYGGLFAKQLEVELESGGIDVAMHSLKDLPTRLPPGLVLAAIPCRDDPRDALCGARLADLALCARVGTGSPRRRSQLLHVRPDLSIVEVRGNVVPRISRLKATSSLSAIVLAMAGLRRVGLDHEATELLPIEQFVPAAGQGAIALEARASDADVLAMLAAVDDLAVRAAVTAERALLHELEGGCSLPLGAHAEGTGSALRLHGQLTSLDGETNVYLERTGHADRPEQLALELANAIRSSGGDSILHEITQTRATSESD
jgi:hydroxymethylbilane synthase